MAEEKKKYLKLNDEEYNHIFSELQRLPKAINSLINFTNTKLSI